MSRRGCGWMLATMTSPASLERGDHLVREEPHGVHHHLPRDRCRPVDLKHDLVGAKILSEHLKPVYHFFRGPKEVDFLRRLGAGRARVGTADAHPSGVI